MKKNIIIMTTTICMGTMPCAKATQFCYEELPVNAEPNLQRFYESDIYNENNFFHKEHGSKYICEINNEIYALAGTSTGYSLPIKLTGDHPSSPSHIWTGDCYYVRDGCMDGVWPDASKYAMPLSLVAENGDVLKYFWLNTRYGVTSYNQHALRIGYANGTYYCLLKPEHPKNIERTIKSTDFEHWEETDEDVPIWFEDVTVAGDNVSFDRTNFTEVLYEQPIEKRIAYTFGDFIVYSDSDNNMYFTNDSVYMKKVDYPAELRQQYDSEKYDTRVKYVYPADGKIIADVEIYYSGTIGDPISKIRLSVPETEFTNELNNMKSAPHVEFNNRLLGFETAPVIENDRTLVPMRFLFEQMGADVEWDQATRTATATMDGTTVAFSIDDTTAEVNGAAATMDVPGKTDQ